MLTVEEIEKILRYHLYVAGKEGCSVRVGGLNETAQAIYEAQKAGYDPWIELFADRNSSTYFLQCRNGRIYRHVLDLDGKGIVQMSLCFVPGEGCGG